MNIYLLLKFILFSIFGYYLFFMIIKNRGDIKPFCHTVFAPAYGLFSLPVILNLFDNPLVIFTFGIIWAYSLRIFIGIFYKSTIMNYELIFFGFINLFNYYFLNPFFDDLIFRSSIESVTFLLSSLLSVYLIDFSISMRKNC